MARLRYSVREYRHGWTYYLGPCHAGVFPTREAAVQAAIFAGQSALPSGLHESVAAVDGTVLVTITRPCSPIFAAMAAVNPAKAVIAAEGAAPA